MLAATLHASDLRSTTAARILQSLRDYTRNAESDSVGWDITSAPMLAEDIRVEVVGREWDVNQKRARFRLRCVPRLACVPFVVQVPLRRAQFDALVVPAAAQRDRPIVRERVVKTGDPVVLIVEGALFRLQTPVTCLENGAPGAAIRVRRKDGRVLRAHVVDRATVEIRNWSSR